MKRWSAGLWLGLLTVACSDDASNGERTRWARRIGGPGSASAAGVVRTQGGLLVAGTFLGPATVDPGGVLDSPDVGGLYAVSYSNDGVPANLRRLAALSARAPWISHLAASKDGAFALAGRLEAEISGDVGFGPAELRFARGDGDVTLSALPRDPLNFVAGWRAGGELAFALATGVGVRGLAAQPDGSTWVAGVYEDGDTFAGLPITPPPSLGESSLYLARITSEGTVAAVIGTSLAVTFYDETPDILAAAPDGLVVTLGSRVTKFGFDGALRWQNEMEGIGSHHAAAVGEDGELLALAGERRVSIAPSGSEPFPWVGEWLVVRRIGPDGVTRRVSTVGARSYGGTVRIAAHPSGGFSIGGHGLGTFVLGGGLRGRSYTSQGRRAFVAEFDAADALVWARTAAANGDFSRLEVHGLAVAEDGASVLAGSLPEAVPFSDGDWSEVLVPEGEDDAFVVKLAGPADELTGAPPRVLRFLRSAESAVTGGAVELSWEVEGAALVELSSRPSGFDFASESSVGRVSSGPLRAPSSFVLTAVGPGGAARAEAGVEVAPVGGTLRDGLRAPIGLTSDGSAFVFAEMPQVVSFEVVKVSLDGAAREVIASGENGLRELAADARGIYWLSDAFGPEGGQLRGRESGGAVRSLSTGEGFGSGAPRLSESHVYWLSGRGPELDSRSIKRARRDDSGPPEVVVGGLPDNSWVLALGPNHVYYTRSQGFENTVLSHRLDDATTATVAVIAEGLGHPMALELDGAELRLALSAPPPEPRIGSPPDVIRIVTVPAAGGELTLVAESRGTLAGNRVPADDRYVYWLERGPEVRVQRAPRAGGEPELIAGYDSTEAQDISGPVLVPGRLVWLIKGHPERAEGKLIAAPR